MREATLYSLLTEMSTQPNKPKERTAPSSWKSSSVAPYYCKRHADSLKPKLRELALDLNNKVFFDCRKLRMSLNACYFRIYQGWLWLIDNDDPDGFYKELKSRTRLVKGKVSITIVHGRSHNAKNLDGEIIKPLLGEEGEVLGWRTQLTDYVLREGEEHIPLEVTGIPFLEEDMDWIAQFLAPFKDSVVLVRMTSTSFKVCKSLKLVEMLKARKAQVE